MVSKARIIWVGIAWWVLGVGTLCACFELIWTAAARLGLVQIRRDSVGTGYSGGWAEVIGFSELVALPLGIIGISIAVITLSRRGKLPGARHVPQPSGSALEPRISARES
ncbi:MAG TPA: hypothetical protein VF669_09945 [Tepidisphaeraceae bacterium]|jgi:hypothetical protein